MSNRDEEALRDALRKMQEDAERNNEEKLAYIRKNQSAMHAMHIEDARERKVKLVATSFALIALLAGMTFSFYQSFVIGGAGNQFERLLGLADNKKVASLDDLKMLEDAMKKLSETYANSLKELGRNGDKNLLELEILSLKSSIDSIDKRLGVLEKAISDNPEKALSILLLRKDQENMVKAIESNRVSASVELARVYDQQKWILGGIGTVLLAAITGLISVLYKLVFRPEQSDATPAGVIR